jgi:hypothetical protein
MEKMLLRSFKTALAFIKRPQIITAQLRRALLPPLNPLHTGQGGATFVSCSVESSKSLDDFVGTDHCPLPCTGPDPHQRAVLEQDPHARGRGACRHVCALQTAERGQGEGKTHALPEGKLFFFGGTNNRCQLPLCCWDAW